MHKYFTIASTFTYICLPVACVQENNGRLLAVLRERKMVERESEREREWSMTQALCEGLNECVAVHQKSVWRRWGKGEGEERE